jgi:hypothetical protein
MFVVVEDPVPVLGDITENLTLWYVTAKPFPWQDEQNSSSRLCLSSQLEIYIYIRTAHCRVGTAASYTEWERWYDSIL